jgi:hypothetical protein
MTVQDFPLTTQIGVFKNEEEIASWLIRQDITTYYPIDYIAFINHAPFIYTSLTDECLIRFKMQKDGYQNFSNIVDEVPAWWVDIYTIMDNEYLRAQKSKANDGR